MWLQQNPHGHERIIQDVIAAGCTLHQNESSLGSSARQRWVARSQGSSARTGKAATLDLVNFGPLFFLRTYPKTKKMELGFGALANLINKEACSLDQTDSNKNNTDVFGNPLRTVKTKRGNTQRVSRIKDQSFGDGSSRHKYCVAKCKLADCPNVYDDGYVNCAWLPGQPRTTLFLDTLDFNDRCPLPEDFPEER